MRKWLILLSYFSVSALNGAAWLTLSPIPEEAKSYYRINDAELTLFSFSFFFMSVILSVPSSILVSKSLKWTMHIMWIGTLLGCWVRVLAQRNFLLAFIGQIFVACGNMPILVACSSVATEWFPQTQVILATSISASANFVGMGISYVTMTHNPDIGQAMWFQSLTGSFLIILHFLVSANSLYPNEHPNLKKDVILAFKEKLHLSFILFTSSGLGITYSLISIIGSLLEENNYNELDTGWMGLIFSLAGLFGGLIAAYLADVKQSTRISLIVFLILAIASSITFAGVINVRVANFILAALYGGTMISTLPLGIRACVEYMNEVHDSIPTNMIYMISQILSCIYTYPIQFFKQITGISGFWLAAFIVLASYVPFLLVIRRFGGENFRKKNLKALTNQLGLQKNNLIISQSGIEEFGNYAES